MRPMLFLSSIIFLGSGASAQEPKPLLPADPPPHKMLHTFLLLEAQKHFDARRNVIAKLKTPEDIQARQQHLKKKFLEALGDFPAKTPLNAKVVGTIKADGYRVEKVIFESRPEHHVTANLYLPEGKGPFPGILIPCGHSANGKSIEAYQRASILMAKNGMVALCYDPIGQGERIQLLDKSGKPAIPGSTSEHSMVGVGALLIGRSTGSYRIWDGIRALDYLESRPEVDPKKLGCTGNSGGGTLTAYLMALDERIACAAPSCYITTLERLFATLGPQDAEQNITGQVAFGMEQTDYLTMRAPRPTLMAVATQDFFDIKGSWTSYKEASEIYKKLGAADRMAIFEYDDKHGWSKPRREACMRWMRKWLLEKDDKPAETDFPHYKDAELQCTRSGQVLEDFRGVSVFDLNRMRDEELAKERGKFVGKKVEEQRKEIEQLLGLPKTIPVLEVMAHSKAKEEFWKENKIEATVKTETGISLTGIVILGNIFSRKGGVIYLDDRGWKGQSEAIKELNKKYYLVAAIDLRGLGETAPGTMKVGKPNFFGVDFKEAFLGIHLNRPLLGQRVLDLLSVIPGEEKFPDKKYQLHLVSRGSTGGLVCLHTAALDQRVQSVEMEGALLSWSNVVHTPISFNQLTNVVPGVLKHYDLPELATMIAPRPLTIRNPVDAQGRPVSQKVLEETYRVTREHYRKLGAEKNLVLEGGR